MSTQEIRCMNVHNSILIKAKKQKEPVCPLTDEWINKMLYNHIIEDYLTIKKDSVRGHATQWTALGNIMLSERQPSQKITYCVI